MSLINTWTCDIITCKKESITIALKQIIIKDKQYHLCPECIISLDTFIEKCLENGEFAYIQPTLTITGVSEVDHITTTGIINSVTTT